VKDRESLGFRRREEWMEREGEGFTVLGEGAR